LASAEPATVQEVSTDKGERRKEKISNLFGRGCADGRNCGRRAVDPGAVDMVSLTQSDQCSGACSLATRKIGLLAKSTVHVSDGTGKGFRGASG